MSAPLRSRFSSALFPLAALLLAALHWSCAPFFEGDRSVPGPPIRVCIADAVQRIEIGTRGNTVVETVRKRYVLPDSMTLTCTVSAKGTMELRAGGTALDPVDGVFRCYSRVKEKTLLVDGKSYSDTLLFATDGSRLYLINVLPLESYLAGVVPNEIGRNRKEDEIEAVKAQAIIARTYAMLKMDLPLTRLFDVYGDTRDQVFTGVVHRTPLTMRAVRETAGRTLQYEGRLAECYFHSTCGGSTEAVSLVWKRPQSKPYLAGISDAHGSGSFCDISPLYRWTELYTRAEFEALLRTFLPSAIDTLDASSIPEKGWHLLDLRIVKRMPSGRVSRLQIIMGDRTHRWSYIVEADKIRWALRRADASAILRSTLFDILLERDADRWISTIRIDGGGNGHGLGMCQWGAIGRAKMGQNVERILSAYFPGTAVERSY